MRRTSWRSCSRSAKSCPSRRAATPLRDYVGLLAFALFVPALAAFAPATEASRHTAGGGGRVRLLRYGALFTLPIAALLWAFDRDDRPSLRTVCLSAAALGLSANLLLELHCGNGKPEHVLLGHASLGLAWLAAWIVTQPRLSRRLTQLTCESERRTGCS